MSISKAIARAWSDADYKTKLLNDPVAALADVGVEVPAGTKINVFENTQDTINLVLPTPPTGPGEVEFDELERIAAGVGTPNTFTCGTYWPC